MATLHVVLPTGLYRLPIDRYTWKYLRLAIRNYPLHWVTA